MAAAERRCTNAAELPSTHLRSAAREFSAVCSRSAHRGLHRVAAWQQGENVFLDRRQRSSHQPRTEGHPDSSDFALGRDARCTAAEGRTGISPKQACWRRPFGWSCAASYPERRPGTPTGAERTDCRVSPNVGQHYRLEYPIGHVLYDTNGYVSDVRVSPDGKLVAFADHPQLGDDSGIVSVVDSSAHKRSLSTTQASILGLAWTPDGKEVWFSGSQPGFPASLNAVDLSGRRARADAHSRQPCYPGHCARRTRAGHACHSESVDVCCGTRTKPGTRPNHRQLEFAKGHFARWAGSAAGRTRCRQPSLIRPHIRASDGSPPVRIRVGDGWHSCPI